MNVSKRILSHRLYKWMVVGFGIALIVVASVLIPAGTVQAGTPGKCFTGVGYNNFSNPEGNHNYVWFNVGSAYTGHATWSISPPNVWSNPRWYAYFKILGYQMNYVPRSGIAHVFFRFRVLPYWVLPPASAWKICAG